MIIFRTLRLIGFIIVVMAVWLLAWTAGNLAKGAEHLENWADRILWR